MMQGQGHPLGVNGAQDLGSCSPQQRLPVVQGVVSQLRWVLGSWHPLHLYHLSEKERPCLQGILNQPAITGAIRRLSPDCWSLPWLPGPTTYILDINLYVPPYHQHLKKPCYGWRERKGGEKGFENKNIWKEQLETGEENAETVMSSSLQRTLASFGNRPAH